MADDRRQFVELFRTLLNAGFLPQSVVEAVLADDLGELRHTGPISVQLQPPDEGEDSPPPPAVPGGC